MDCYGRESGGMLFVARFGFSGDGRESNACKWAV